MTDSDIVRHANTSHDVDTYCDDCAAHDDDDTTFVINRIIPVRLTREDCVETGPATGVFLTGPVWLVLFDETYEGGGIHREAYIPKTVTNPLVFVSKVMEC